MTQQEAANRWYESAQEDLKTAEALFQLEKYAPCLFFCHLAVEKMLKAVYTKKYNDAPPILHHLGKLWQKVGLPFGPVTEEQLSEISTFNIEARYDIDKLRLYKKATKEYTQKYLSLTKEILIWLKSHL